MWKPICLVGLNAWLCVTCRPPMPQMQAFALD